MISKGGRLLFYFVFSSKINNIGNIRTEKSIEHILVIAEMTTIEKIYETNETNTRINIK